MPDGCKEQNRGYAALLKPEIVVRGEAFCREEHRHHQHARHYGKGEEAAYEYTHLRLYLILRCGPVHVGIDNAGNHEGKGFQAQNRE